LPVRASSKVQLMTVSLLGIDLGTSSVKAALVDAATGQLFAIASEEYPIHTPQPGFAEQEPFDYWRAVVRAVQQVLKASPAQVAAVGLTGQMHGTVLLDPLGKPLRPAIIWPDARTVDEPQRLLERVPEWAQIAGTNPAAGFQCTTLAWLHQHDPYTLSETAVVLLPKDYVRLCLTGRAATDVSDAAGTGLMDVRRAAWSEALLGAVGVSPSQMPPILESHTVAGELTAEAAEALGLPKGLPVVAGCADQPAQALGSGLVRPGVGSVTIGTGGQVFIPYRPRADLKTDPRVHVFNHAVPQTWYVLGATLSAGSSLRWMRNLFGLEGIANAYERLSVEAGRTPPGADGLLFLPYLFGERTPLMDPMAQGAFVGLQYRHERGHVARAIMEGVAFALRDAVQISVQLGAHVSEVVIAGGGARSTVWRQIMADVLGLPLKRSRQEEQTVLGAALLAGVGVGIYPDAWAAARLAEQYDTPTVPNSGAHAFYNELYAQYQGLYPALRETMHRLHALTQRAHAVWGVSAD
jgi:xylulokinase